jgi:hypothetical protein
MARFPLLSLLPECIRTHIFEIARRRALLRRVCRKYRVHVDRFLLPSASAPLHLTIPLAPAVGGRRAWKTLLSSIVPAPHERIEGWWAHRFLRLVSPRISKVSPNDPRPARLSAWPTLINCLRAAHDLGVSRHIDSIEIEFGAPYVDRLDEDSLRPFGIITVSQLEFVLLLSQTSLGSFVLRAAACDRTSPSVLTSYSALPVLMSRLSAGLGACPALTRFELIDTTPSVYGTDRSHRQHAVEYALPLATQLLRKAPLAVLRIEGVVAEEDDTADFWQTVRSLDPSPRVLVCD